MKRMLWLTVLMSFEIFGAETYYCKNPALLRMDYVITKMDGKTYDFRVEKNTTDPWSSRSRWGTDITTEIIFQEQLKASGNILLGKRTQIDLTHPAHVSYEYVVKTQDGQFVEKTSVLICEVKN